MPLKFTTWALPPLGEFTSRKAAGGNVLMATAVLTWLVADSPWMSAPRASTSAAERDA